MHPTQKRSRTAGTGDLTPADALRGAARYIEVHGWTQRDYYAAPATVKTPFPAACAEGAIAAACYGRATEIPYCETGEAARLFRRAAFAFEVHIGELDGSDSIGLWNDRTGRTAAEVATELRAAADVYDRTRKHMPGGAR